MTGSTRAVVVTHNSATVVVDCLASLERGRNEVAGPGLEIVVVDNESRDSTVDEVKRFGHVRLIGTGANIGYAAAVNIGRADAAPGVHVLLLNPDVRLQPGALAAMHAALSTTDELGRRIGIVVPSLWSADGVRQWSMRRRPTVLRSLGDAVLGGDRAGQLERWGERVTSPRAYERPTTVDWASGAAFLMDCELLDQIGPWDESFFLYSEEIDFCLRAADAGWVVRYVPAARAVHLGGEQHASAKLHALSMANRVVLHRKRRGRLPASALRAVLAANEVLRLCKRGDLHRAGLATLLGGERSRRELIRSLQEA